MLIYLNGKKYRPGDNDDIDLTLMPIFNYRDLYLPTRTEILGDDDVNED